MDYTVALYIRLSAADDDKDGESDSVVNQRDLLNLYIATNAEFANCNTLTFVDDGYTGANFDRPAAKQMLEKAKRGQVNCIIVKDFSRFGRNYIEVGDYLEQIFPFLGVRFISVNDRYDSKDTAGCTLGLDVAFKTFLHALYCKDVSYKVINGRRAKAEKGEHLCSIAPYGYQKSKTEKNKLVVDEETAPIVRYIYELATQGLSQTQIARQLNSENIDTPLGHRKKKGTHVGRGWTAKSDTNVWTHHNVGRILRDVMYTGAMVNGKRIRIEISCRKTKAVPRDEWIVVPDAHEAIVSAEVYEAAQKLLPKFGTRTWKSENLTLFSGKVFCGHCGFALKRSKVERPHFVCYSKTSVSSELCLRERVYEDTVKEVVLRAFKQTAELVLAFRDKELHATKRRNATQVEITSGLIKLSAKERQLSEQKAQLFDDFASGKISKDEYRVFKEKIATEIETVSLQKAELESKARNFASAPTTNHLCDLLDKLTGIQEVTPDIVSFIERIVVYDSERIEIKFAFADELARLCGTVNASESDNVEVSQCASTR